VQEHKVILTWEAIYDVAGIADYIESDFGKSRADRFEVDIKNEMQRIGCMAKAYKQTQIVYRGYVIRKKPFPPSVIFITGFK
jgi:plasmid stabilization system protein ParE